MRRLLLQAGLAGAVVATTLVVSAGAAMAASGTVHTDSGAPLTVRSDASTSASAIGSVASGSTITITCQKYGSTVTGKYGTSNIWDKLSSGGYVTDTYVYTGSDGLVAPICGGVSTKVQNAINWARARIGHTDWNNECELFVERAFGTSGRFATAMTHYNWQRNNGRIHGGTAPAGAVVFFTSTTSAGHVALSIGNGTAISTGPSVYYLNVGSRSDYLGWAYVEDMWPGL